MPCCIPGAYEQLSAMLAELEKQQPVESLPPEQERPRAAQWKTWLWPHESAEGLPPLRIILVLDNLAGHLSPDLLGWFFHHGVMPLYTPVGGRLSEHGRVGAAHHRAPGAFRPASHTCEAESSTGWSKPWPAGTTSPRPLCGMASGAGDANGRACAA